MKSLIIYYTYKNTYSGVMYNPRFNVSLIMITMVTTIVMVVIGSNISVSLGMVGALSIIRFRTAIKDPMDTAFMFWAITAGIMSGTGLYLVAIVGTLTLGLFFFLSNSIVFKTNSKYLCVLKYDESLEKEINEKLEDIKYTLKSKSVVKGVVEMTFEVALKENDTSILDEFKKLDIISSSIISYQNDFGA